jgi:MFS transporter, NNP family, nitrate/nitrite transporter
MSEPVTPATPFRFRRLSFLVSVVFFSFFCRMVFSPLLPAIESDLNISHVVGGSFFFFIALGYTTTMLVSGFFLRFINHRNVIVIAVVLAGVGVGLVARSQSVGTMRLALVVVGMGAGLYPPSGITTLTSLVPKARWGTATAIHEIGPNLVFVLAPFFVELMLRVSDWRGTLLVTSGAAIFTALVYGVFSEGGRFRGAPPHFSNIRLVIGDPAFWMAAVFMIWAMVGHMGIYSMLPTYLVSEVGIARSTVNTLVGLSRTMGLVAIFLAGALADRFGVRRLLVFLGVSGGAFILGIGLLSGWSLVVAVFLQALTSAALFPVVLTALSGVGPEATRNLNISLTVPFGYILGGGLVPLGMGWMAEVASFRIGFLILGGLMALYALGVALRRPKSHGVASDL